MNLGTGAYELQMLSPFWVAGNLPTNGAILSAAGRYAFMATRIQTGRYCIERAQAHPQGRHYIYTLAQELGVSATVHSMTEDAGETSTSMRVRFTSWQDADRDTELSFTILA